MANLFLETSVQYRISFVRGRHALNWTSRLPDSHMAHNAWCSTKQWSGDMWQGAGPPWDRFDGTVSGPTDASVDQRQRTPQRAGPPWVTGSEWVVSLKKTPRRTQKKHIFLLQIFFAPTPPPLHQKNPQFVPTPPPILTRKNPRGNKIYPPLFFLRRRPSILLKTLHPKKSPILTKPPNKIDQNTPQTLLKKNRSSPKKKPQNPPFLTQKKTHFLPKKLLQHTKIWTTLPHPASIHNCTTDTKHRNV